MGKLLIVTLCLLLNSECQAQSKEMDITYKHYGRSDGCDGVFEFGDSELMTVDTLPEFELHDSKVKLTGIVYEQDGKTPAKDVIVHIYQTNEEGKYPKKGNETGWAKYHGYIRGWVQTDSDGRYTFYTFKPGSYGSGAAHIHMTVLEPDGKYYYVDDINFDDDPNLNLSGDFKKWGGSGIVRLKKDGDLLLAERDIILGLNVENYD